MLHGKAPRVGSALSLLIRKHDRIDPLQALEMVNRAGGVRLSDLAVYLKIVLSQKRLCSVDGQILQKLYTMEHADLVYRLDHYRRAETTVGAAQQCLACGELLKNVREVVVFANGRVACGKCYAANQCDSVSQLRSVRGHRVFDQVFIE